MDQPRRADHALGGKCISSFGVRCFASTKSKLIADSHSTTLLEATHSRNNNSSKSNGNKGDNNGESHPVTMMMTTMIMIMIPWLVTTSTHSPTLHLPRYPPPRVRARRPSLPPHMPHTTLSNNLIDIANNTPH